jgi:hypothetical protein
MVRRLTRLAPIAGLVAGCSTGAGTTAPPGPSNLTLASAPDPSMAAVIAKYQTRIPQLMAEQNVPGIAVAVVDGDHVLWAQGFTAGWHFNQDANPNPVVYVILGN